MLMTPFGGFVNYVYVEKYNPSIEYIISARWNESMFLFLSNISLTHIKFLYYT